MSATAHATVLLAAAPQHTVLAAGTGLVNMAHEVLYILIALAGAFFLGCGIVNAVRKHHKNGVGAAVSALAGGVLLAVFVAHIVGIYQRGNQEFENLPGSVGTPGHSGTRSW